MAVSFTRPDPSSPASVADAAFSTVRKGFDQQEVREFLRQVANELSQVLERVDELEQELQGARAEKQVSPDDLDEATIMRLVGEETARILQAAHESAAQIRSRAEDGAESLLSNATEEATRVREEAAAAIAEQRSEAARAAEAEIGAAKEQGRQMVNEARAYRERVLAELARRRDLARQQIERLIGERDRLMSVFVQARNVAADVVDALEPLKMPDDEAPPPPGPPSGPTPIVVADVATPAEGDVDTAHDVELDHVVEVDDTSDVDEADAAEPSADTPNTDADAEMPDVEGPNLDAADGESPDIEPQDVEQPDVDPSDVTTVRAPVVALFPGAGDDVGRGESEGDDSEPDDSGEVDIDVTESSDETATDAGDDHDDSSDIDDADDTGKAAQVDDLFARLRAAAPESGESTDEADESTDVAVMSEEEPEPAVVDGTPDDGADDEADDDDTTAVIDRASPFAQRDAELGPLTVESARKLKRVLADELNEVLDTLRQEEPVRRLDHVLADESTHASRYLDALYDHFEAAAQAGAASNHSDDAGADVADVSRSGALGPVRDMLVTQLVTPLRERVARAVDEADGDNGVLTKRVRSIYREWKTQRIDAELDDLLRLAYGRGLLAAVPAGTPVRWIVDPNGPECPDAEDNSLAEPVPAGDPFPTGHVCAPAHPGCRCLLSPTNR